MDKVTSETEEGTGSVAGIRDAFSVDAERVGAHLDELVRGTVEQTLNALLDAEADRACNAGRYEHAPDRQDTRAGTYRGVSCRPGPARWS